MFWKKPKIKTAAASPKKKQEDFFPYPKRTCWLYISDKYQQILFVPMGNIDPWSSREINKVLVEDWPLSIDELQNGIQQTLDHFQDAVTDTNYSKETWYSFQNSKAKTQRSFKVEYVQILLETDFARSYGPEEVERIAVQASPIDWVQDSYKIVGTAHLMEVEVAQKVLDIYRACEKIRK